MKVAFCTPFGKPASPSHYRQKAIAQSKRLQDTFHLVEVEMMVVSKARNALLTAIPPDMDVAWFVDADIRLPDNAHTLLDLIEDHPVVSGLYFSRWPPHYPVVYNRAGAGDTTFAYFPFVNLPDKPFYADGVGAGCLLVRTWVFRKIAEEYDKWQAEVQEWKESHSMPPRVERAFNLGLGLDPYFEFLESVGEDLYFCEQLRYFLNMRPLVDPRVACEHEQTVPITRAHFEQYMRQNELHYHEGARDANRVHADNRRQVVEWGHSIRAGVGRE